MRGQSDDRQGFTVGYLGAVLYLLFSLLDVGFSHGKVIKYVLQTPVGSLYFVS